MIFELENEEKGPVAKVSLRKLKEMNSVILSINGIDILLISAAGISRYRVGGIGEDILDGLGIATTGSGRIAYIDED